MPSKSYQKSCVFEGPAQQTHPKPSVFEGPAQQTQQNPVEEIMVDLSDGLRSLNTSQNVSLEVNDLVVVRSMLGYQSKEFVSVSGLAKNPGDYALKTNNYSIYDLIKDFDGFLLDANLKGIKLKRKIDFESFDDILEEEIDEEQAGGNDEEGQKMEIAEVGDENDTNTPVVNNLDSAVITAVATENEDKKEKAPKKSSTIVPPENQLAVNRSRRVIEPRRGMVLRIYLIFTMHFRTRIS